MSELTTKKGNVKLYTTSILWKNKIQTMPISLLCITSSRLSERAPLRHHHIDLLALRPDPAVYLDIGKTYKAVFHTEVIFLPSLGTDIEIIRAIEIRDVDRRKSSVLRFVNIR